jgi:integrase
MKSVDQAPGIFTVDELNLLLEKSPAELLPMFAIGAFAELVRLEWNDIDLRRGFINMPANKSKTARRRLIKMAPNLQAWLSPYVHHTGRLWTQHRDHYHRVVTQAGLAE